jgi:hypothetical protein
MNASPRERFNWGYWDGRADQATWRYAPWAKRPDAKHPFDALYGQGYWAGRYDDSGPDTSDEAWSARRKLR